MSKAYRIVFACPKGGHNINLQRKISKPALSENEAMKIFGEEEIACDSPDAAGTEKYRKQGSCEFCPLIGSFLQ